MTKPIESTGNILTIPQRERDARRHIIDVLATNEQRLWTLNEQEAARYVQAAIDTLKTTMWHNDSLDFDPFDAGKVIRKMHDSECEGV